METLHEHGNDLTLLYNIINYLLVGSDCEYRHSDSARLNPRDCWYWLNGSCRNPNCAFRHPPLEGFNGVKADSLFIPPHSGIPTSKSDVPCYFYFNAICSKGEQCPFLHDSFPAQKVSKAVPEATANHPREVKISISDTGPPSVELPVNPPAETLEPTKKSNYSNQVPQRAAPSSALEEPSHSTESMVPDSEEPADNLLPSVEFMDHNGQLSPYQSSEELVKECVEQELDERWESSPGFDVIVDDGSEQLVNEDDVEYQLSQNKESEMLRNRLLEYDFEGSADYEHAGYSDAGYLYDQCLYNNYDHMNDGYSIDYFQEISEVPREERTFKPMLDRHRKRKLLHRVHDAHIRENVMDLREQLRKRKRIDAHWAPMNSGRRRRSHIQERPLRNGVNCSVHSRLASQVGKCMIASSQGGRESTFEDHDRQGWRGHSETSRFTRSRLRERERRRHWNPSRNSSMIQLTSALDGEKSVKATADHFTGPKTLAQIKEEKSMAKADGKSLLDLLPQRHKRHVTVDFESPKSLVELLKDKRKSERPQDSTPAKLEDADECFQVEKKPRDAEVNDWHLKATAGNLDREFVNGYLDDERCDDDNNGDDDDDFFQKQLAHMFSH